MSHFLDASVLEPVRAEFDADFYLDANDDVAEAGADPFEHFLIFGWREGRDPNARFSIRRYLDMNPDVRASGMNAFVHWIAHGRQEGRATDHGMGFRFETLWIEPSLETRIHDLRKAIPDRPADPDAALSDAIAALRDSGAVHVTVSHDDYTRGVGGVQLCIRLESDALRAAGRRHLHVFPSAAGVMIDVERDAPTLGLLLDGRLVGHFAPEQIADHVGPVVASTAATFAVHSLIGHPAPRTSSMLKALGMSEGFFWLHDYASLCAGYALMRDDVAFCGAPPIDSAACEICAYGQRRRVQLPAHVDLFQTFRMTVVAPSRAALDLWRTRFPVAADAMVVQPHAHLVRRTRQPRVRKADGPLKVGFLGMPLTHKGWGTFTDLAARFADDPRYAFHHLGKSRDPRVPAAFTPVAPSDDRPQPMIPAIEATGLDVVFLWSLWPETFCFAAYEAVAAGAALITNPDAGNVVDFVQEQSDRGLILNDEAALFAAFESGDVRALARARRKPSAFDLGFSRMTADLILEQAP